MTRAGIILAIELLKKEVENMTDFSFVDSDFYMNDSEYKKSVDVVINENKKEANDIQEVINFLIEEKNKLS